MRAIGSDFWAAVVRALQRALPQACVLCAAPSGNAVLCPACAQALPRTAAACRLCALPSNGSICGECLARAPPFAGTVAAWTYAFPVDQLLQAFKYGGALALAEPLADALAAAVRGRGASDCDGPVALPLSRVRQRHRGFNQAPEAARRVA